MIFDDMTRTEWFLLEDPEHAGVYERMLHGEIRFAFWDGSRWYMNGISADTAAVHYAVNARSRIPQAPWRGLAAKL